MLADAGGDDCPSRPGVSLFILTALIKGGSSGCKTLCEYFQYLAFFVFSPFLWHFVSASPEFKGSLLWFAQKELQQTIYSLSGSKLAWGYEDSSNISRPDMIERQRERLILRNWCTQLWGLASLKSVRQAGDPVKSWSCSLEYKGRLQAESPLPWGISVLKAFSWLHEAHPYYGG